jgi:hypothetical protein
MAVPRPGSHPDMRCWPSSRPARAGRHRHPRRGSTQPAVHRRHTPGPREAASLCPQRTFSGAVARSESARQGRAAAPDVPYGIAPPDLLGPFASGASRPAPGVARRRTSRRAGCWNVGEQVVLNLVTEVAGHDVQDHGRRPPRRLSTRERAGAELAGPPQRRSAAPPRREADQERASRRAGHVRSRHERAPGLGGFAYMGGKSGRSVAARLPGLLSGRVARGAVRRRPPRCSRPRYRGGAAPPTTIAVSLFRSS